MDRVEKDLADFFQVLKDKGCFHDETQPVKDAFSEIEKKLIPNEEEKADSN